MNVYMANKSLRSYATHDVSEPSRLRIRHETCPSSISQKVIISMKWMPSPNASLSTPTTFPWMQPIPSVKTNVSLVSVLSSSPVRIYYNVHPWILRSESLYCHVPARELIEHPRITSCIIHLMAESLSVRIVAQIGLLQMVTK